MKSMEQRDFFDGYAEKTRLNGSVFSAFSTLVSLVVVFRTLQAHSRFLQGIAYILSEWADAASRSIALSAQAQLRMGWRSGTVSCA